MVELTRMVVVPMDGSQNATRSLDYIDFMFGPKHNLEVNLLYVPPFLPDILTDDPQMSQEEKLRLKSVESKNIQMAEPNALCR